MRYYIYNLDTKTFISARGEVIPCDKRGHHIKPDLYYISVSLIKEATSFLIQDAIAICSIKNALYNSMLIPEQLDGQPIACRVFEPKPITGHFENNKALYDFISSKLKPSFAANSEIPLFWYELYEGKSPLGFVQHIQDKGWEFSKNLGVFASTAPGAVIEHKTTMLESLTILKSNEIATMLARPSYQPIK